jgi:hypothetical protein
MEGSHDHLIKGLGPDRAAKRLGPDAFLWLQLKAAYYDFLIVLVSFYYMPISRECSRATSRFLSDVIPGLTSTENPKPSITGK